MDENNQVVKDPPTTEQPPEGQAVTPEEVTPPAPAGSKTDQTLLLKSLKEEREKRQLLEEELTRLKDSSALSEEVFSDEGKVLEKKISALGSELSELRQESAKKDVLIAHPELKEKWEEFEEFRSQSDNKGMNLRTAAKAYLVENGLLEPVRKGLEKPTGGPRVPMTSGMTAEDVKTLRETNFKKYQEMLLKGQIKIE